MHVGIWPLYYDGLLHDMAWNQSFKVHKNDVDVALEDENVVDTMLSLSQGN